MAIANRKRNVARRGLLVLLISVPLVVAGCGSTRDAATTAGSSHPDLIVRTQTEKGNWDKAMEALDKVIDIYQTLCATGVLPVCN